MKSKVLSVLLTMIICLGVISPAAVSAGMVEMPEVSPGITVAVPEIPFLEISFTNTVGYVEKGIGAYAFITESQSVSFNQDVTIASFSFNGFAWETNLEYIPAYTPIARKGFEVYSKNGQHTGDMNTINSLIAQTGDPSYTRLVFADLNSFWNKMSPIMPMADYTGATYYYVEGYYSQLDANAGAVPPLYALADLSAGAYIPAAPAYEPAPFTALPTAASGSQFSTYRAEVRGSVGLANILIPEVVKETTIQVMEVKEGEWAHSTATLYWIPMTGTTLSFSSYIPSAFYMNPDGAHYQFKAFLPQPDGTYTENMVNDGTWDMLYDGSVGKILNVSDWQYCIEGAVIFTVSAVDATAYLTFTNDAGAAPQPIAQEPIAYEDPYQPAEPEYAAPVSLGEIYYSDVVAYIDDMPIPTSVTGDGKVLVVVEDLRRYGFKVSWSYITWTLAVTPNPNGLIAPLALQVNDMPAGTVKDTLIATEIVTTLSGEPVNTYAVEGMTMIDFQLLAKYGSIVTDEAANTVKLTTSGYVPPVPEPAPAPAEAEGEGDAEPAEVPAEGGA